MSLVDAQGNPVTPQLDQGQMVNMMSGLRIRIDAANAQLVQLGLLVEYLYENLEKQDIKISMEEFPVWAEARYKEIQTQAQEMMESTKEEVENIKQNIKNAASDVADALKNVEQQAAAAQETNQDTENTSEETTEETTEYLH